MANLAIHLVIVPGKTFHFSGKLARHCSPKKKDNKEETDKPIKEKETERGENIRIASDLLNWFKFRALLNMRQN